MEEALIDRQAMLIPSWDEWRVIERDFKLDGTPIGIRGQLTVLLQLLRNEANVEIGLIPPGPNRFNTKRVMPIVLVRLDGHRQRVHITSVKCTVCGRDGIVADPTEPDIYTGVADKYSAIDRARELPTLPCPKCGAILSRPAIWMRAAPDSGGR